MSCYPNNRKFTATMSCLLKNRLLLLFSVVLPNVASAASSGDARYFRSDEGVAASAAGPLPDHFDSPDLLRWRVPMDSGHSTPILWKGRVFLTTYRAESRELATVALDEKSGQILWRRPIAVERVEQTHPIGSPATATPACNDQRLFVFFGSYGLICYDLDGNRLWETALGPFRDEYGAGSSPVLIDGKIVLNQDHDIDSFLAALDCASGKLLWKVRRPDAVRSYSTPAVWERQGRKELLVAGALELAGYDPASGERLWWVNGLARIVIPTPVPVGEIIYMASWAPGGDAGRRLALDAWPAALAKWDKNHDGKLAKAEIDDHEVLDRFYRMDLDQSGLLDQKEWDHHAEVFRRAQNAVLALKPSGRGELSESAVVWKYQRGVPYVSTPLLDKGLLWMVKDGGIVTKLDAATGRMLQEERVPGIGNYFASPAAGDGKVYFASESGVVSVVADQPEWRVISSHEFREKIYASPVIDRDRIYLRSEQALYCFEGGKK
jgi:outer membrane protein assembly factor BamB